MDKKHQQLGYILISIAMYLPVLLWPLPLVLYDNPMLAENIAPTWFLSSALFLLCVVSMDSMLYVFNKQKHALDAMIWVSMFTLMAVFAFQNQHNIWFIAILFFTHALRSGYLLLIGGNNHWWLWTAWTRDISTAITILMWIDVWPN